MTLTTDFTTVAELDSALLRLSAGERRWADLPLTRRADLLQQVAHQAAEQASDWVEAACRAKRISPSSPLAGEEWLSGPYPVITNAATLARSLRDLSCGDSPIAHVPTSVAPGGRVALDVFPHQIWDRLLLSGVSAKVWLKPGVSVTQARSAAGLAQLDPATTHGMSVVLGAGNITSIAVLDTLYELIAHNRVVILKLNPVLGEMFDAINAVLRPLSERGFVEVVRGGVEVGSYLVDHPNVAHVHITGSSASHDAIVFGTGPEGEARRRAGVPKLGKTITSELGGVSPTVVVPTGWSAKDIRFQAEHLATQRLHNGGYNCIAAQVAVIPSEWSKKGEFLRELRDQIDKAPARPAYYPGSDQRVAAAADRHATANARENGRLLIEGLSPDQVAEAFTVEYFSPVLAVVEIPGDGIAYLRAASRFVNERLEGTLGANVLVHPRYRRKLGREFEWFVESLRYGTIAINAWTGVGYLTAAAPWGGFPGATLVDVESGIGLVHNASLVDDTERTVVTGPFRPLSRSLITGQLSITPKPAWFVRNTHAHHVGRKMVAFAADPKATRLPSLFASALRG
ncbi:MULTISPECIES: aldehyde dehydrogenase family protein [Gordonia]|jgi:aldehyde dehydrogenase (NAD(P)+)|uniref:Aldehyde dehydrogenase n=2 Tax=Gordonia TaxID=2053 RepID=R7Y372_9ACTN|nr:MULTISPECIES: aldehyde dehydrogenase family protein [Gordonia]MDY6808780.1 aldehyde dehydrogenase family protein [Actinomycetota bacterium]EON30470.1 aldehyde dehydrogenase [Gordonia terrae C-6]MAU84325.1 aldehyde dehydrogenase [Gordonia sp. (in: high G+C Gram-positive bacteria)]MCR8900131.1 aldehyde dehydrogenase family protein [Gordonia sp. GONU]MDH3009381.1 aldehyde dehydrogenase family protein [Gordonia alkanivorans]